MRQVGKVLMMDGGWGFALSTGAERARRLWITYETEEEAIAARAAILAALKNALIVSEGP